MSVKFVIDSNKYLRVENGEWYIFNDKKNYKYPACYCSVKYNNVCINQRNELELEKIYMRNIRKMKLDKLNNE